MSLSLYTILIYSFVFQVQITTFSPYRAYQHNFCMVYLNDHGYDAEGEIVEEIPTKECFRVYLIGDFSFGRLPEDE